MNNNVTATSNGDFEVEYCITYKSPINKLGFTYYHMNDPYIPDGAVAVCSSDLPDGYIWCKKSAKEKDPKDNVNHPSHYSGKIECIEAIAVATDGLVGMEAVCTANVLKYTWRWKRKNGVEDLKKAKWYLEDLIKRLEDENKLA